MSRSPQRPRLDGLTSLAIVLTSSVPHGMLDQIYATIWGRKKFFLLSSINSSQILKTRVTIKEERNGKKLYLILTQEILMKSNGALKKTKLLKAHESPNQTGASWLPVYRPVYTGAICCDSNLPCKLLAIQIAVESPVVYTGALKSPQNRAWDRRWNRSKNRQQTSHKRVKENRRWKSAQVY